MLDSELADWATTLTLIFGGCMSNALALEQCTVLLPRSGTLVTAMGFLAVSICFLPSQLVWPSGSGVPRLSKPHVPIQRWIIQVALFFSTNLLNNVAFAFHVPMPVHIIFRSGGLVVNMVLGWALAGNKYNLLQIISVLLVTGGVTLSTLAAGHKGGMGLNSDMYGQYLIGISLLLLSLVVSGFMGLWQEGTFRACGKASWKESLFYTHSLSLPLFLLFFRSLHAQILDAVRTPDFGLPLLANALTQIVCIAGVNRLTTRVSSVAVTLTLAVRKAASLALSIAWAQARGAPVPNPLYLWGGTAMVLVGTVGYAHASSPANRTKSELRTKRSLDQLPEPQVVKNQPDQSTTSAVPPKHTSTNVRKRT